MNQFVLPTAELLHSTGEAQTALHERAADAARSRFGQNVFVRAVVEISNFCRENCLYCGMRRSNRALKRFRARHEQIADLLIHHRPQSVTELCRLAARPQPNVSRSLAILQRAGIISMTGSRPKRPELAVERVTIELLDLQNA